MVDSRGSGAIMGTTAPEIGHALLQTVAVLTSDAGQSVSEDIIFSTLHLGGRERAPPCQVYTCWHKTVTLHSPANIV